MKQYNFDFNSFYQELHEMIRDEDLGKLTVSAVQQEQVFRKAKEIFTYLPGAVFSVNILLGQIVMQHKAAALIECEGEFNLNKYHDALDFKNNPVLVEESTALMRNCMNKSYKDVGFMGGCFNANHTINLPKSKIKKLVSRYAFPFQMTKSGIVTEYLNIIFEMGSSSSSTFNSSIHNVPEELFSKLKVDVDQRMRKRQLFTKNEGLILGYHLNPHSIKFSANPPKNQAEVAQHLEMTYHTLTGTKKRLLDKIHKLYFDPTVTQSITWDEAIERLKVLKIRID